MGEVIGVSNSTVEHDFEAAAKPRKPRLKAGPIKHGQYLLNRPQLLELCGQPLLQHRLALDEEGRLSASARAWPGGRQDEPGVLDRRRSLRLALEARPRRAIGNLKQARAAQETKHAPSAARSSHSEAGEQVRDEHQEKAR